MNHSALSRAGLCLLAAVSLFVPTGSALLELDRGVIILTTNFGVSYDSNILGRSSGDSDTLFTFSPSFEFRREAGRGTVSAGVGASFVAYASQSGRNHEDYHLNGAVTAPVSQDSPFSGGMNASYGRSTDVNETVGDLVTTKALSLGVNGGYAFSERLSGSVNVNYGTVKNENFGDNDSLSASLGISLVDFLLRRLPLTFSYSYSQSQSTNDPTPVKRLDTTSHSLNVGTGGQISPKVKGNISVGLRSTDDKGAALSSGSSDTGVVASSSLAWSYDELTTVALALSKSLAVTADNQSTDTTNLSFNVSRKLSEQLSASAGVSHSWNNYRGTSRNYRLLGFNGGLSYLIRRNWSAGASYSYTKESSDSGMNNFDRHVVGFTVSGRF